MADFPNNPEAHDEDNYGCDESEAVIDNKDAKSFHKTFDIELIWKFPIVIRC